MRSCGAVDIDPTTKSEIPSSPQTNELARKKKMYTVTVSENLPDKMRQGRETFVDQLSKLGNNNKNDASPRPDKIIRLDASDRRIDEFLNDSGLNGSTVSQVELVPITDELNMSGNSVNTAPVNSL